MAIVLEAGFLNQGFINSMRFSELNGDEEYDNTFLYITWHALASGGMQQVREQVADLERLKRTAEQYMAQSEASRERIEDFLAKARKYQYDKPIDDVENIKVMNNELADYNENLMDATDLFYNGHIAILNGRMARARGHKKEAIELSRNVDDKERQISEGEEKKKRFGLF